MLSLSFQTRWPDLALLPLTSDPQLLAELAVRPSPSLPALIFPFVASDPTVRLPRTHGADAHEARRLDRPAATEDPPSQSFFSLNSDRRARCQHFGALLTADTLDLLQQSSGTD